MEDKNFYLIRDGRAKNITRIDGTYDESIHKNLDYCIQIVVFARNEKEALEIAAMYDNGAVDYDNISLPNGDVTIAIYKH